VFTPLLVREDHDLHDVCRAPLNAQHSTSCILISQALPSSVVYIGCESSIRMHLLESFILLWDLVGHDCLGMDRVGLLALVPPWIGTYDKSLFVCL